MSAPVDVLGVMLQAETRCGSALAEAVWEARAAVAELLAADHEYDSARSGHDEAGRLLGNWRVNPLGHTHPAVVRLRAAAERRRAALAKIGAAA